MYTVHKNVQIIIALLKAYGIRQVVISAGTRHIPFVFSVEQDDFFQCYSIVDERSAAFFALGIIQEKQEPAVIICTSGTATCNYLSAVSEAFYQHLPLVVLTSDRNPYFLNQQEEQCIPQSHLFQQVVKCEVTLPIVRDERDFWYSNRLVNEALLELSHREKGPVHINFPIDDNYPIELGTFKFSEAELPQITKIDRITTASGDEEWKAIAETIARHRTLILYGQSLPLSSGGNDAVERFAEAYQAVVLCDELCNLPIGHKIHAPLLISHMSQDDWEKLRPEIVITMNGSLVVNVKKALRQMYRKIRHWHCSPEGKVSDPFMCQDKIIECTPGYFFEKMCAQNVHGDTGYFEMWKNMEHERIRRDVMAAPLRYSSVYAVRELMRSLPQNALLHISNSNNVRISNMFPLHESVTVYCNRGTCGIDGTMSSYVAQSYVTSRPSFLMIGDLSFFYDMNALWNRYCTPNTRIMLCNNSGGALFHSSFYKQVADFGSIDRHIAASHETSAKGWAEARGFKYLCSTNEKEFVTNLTEFVGCNNDKPLLFEVFTDKDIDIQQMGIATNSVMPSSSAYVKNLAAAMPSPVKRTIKSILKKS